MEAYGSLTALGPLADAVSQRLAALTEAGIARRLWQRDVRLWSDDPAHHAVAKNRLGWLDGPAAMRKAVPELRAFAIEVAQSGMRRALLLGMGGSSLGPEVLRLAFGVAPGALDLQVLDSTDPAAVKAAMRELERTLFVVASKSGGTVEVQALHKHFAALRPGRQFVAITDPNTALAELAKGFRRTFLNPPDIGGRYSALSYFGLVPAALLGLELERFVDGAAAMAEACGPEREGERNPGVWLGAVLAEAVAAGRDKLTLIASPGLSHLGCWIEQLVAESTGKSGRGIVPIDGEPVGAPPAYGKDRLFVMTRTREDSKTGERLNSLARAGHPIVDLVVEDLYELGGEMFRWEVATAVAASVMRVDPFDEPNVKEAKDLTRELLETHAKTGALPAQTPRARTDALELYADAALPSGGDSVRELLRSHLDRANPGDYHALLAYLPRTAAIDRELAGLRVPVRDRRRIATTLGYGPRYLHSTGQLHKGGPNTGLYLLLTADPVEDLPVPGERYTFGVLERAQALGDFGALERHGRRVVRVHLGSDIPAGLRALRAELEA